MGTTKPKLTAYLTQENYERLQIIAEVEGLSLSQALDRVLTAHFNGAVLDAAPSAAPLELAQIPGFKDWAAGIELRLSCLEEALDAEVEQTNKLSPEQYLIQHLSSAAPSDAPSDAPPIEPQSPSLARWVIEMDEPVHPDPESPSTAIEETSAAAESRELERAASNQDDIDVSRKSFSNPLSGLNGAALAKRLKVSPVTISQRRDRADFPQWSETKDPDGLRWIFRKWTRLFYPIAKPEPEQTGSSTSDSQGQGPSNGTKQQSRS